jgi:hypothetical protein
LQEEELEDARAATQKKVKALEQQLENEHEERLNFVRVSMLKHFFSFVTDVAEK